MDLRIGTLDVQAFAAADYYGSNPNTTPLFRFFYFFKNFFNGEIRLQAGPQ